MVTKVTDKLNQLDSKLASALAQLDLIRLEVCGLRESNVSSYAVDVLLDAIDKLDEVAENLANFQCLLSVVTNPLQP